MATMKKPDERYDKKIHGNITFTDYPQKKPARGYYTVLTNIRNHLWVKYDYFFNGSGWVTPGHSLTNSVIGFDIASWRVSGGGQ